MSRIALIRDGVVVNVIEASLEFATGLPGYDHAMEAGDAGPGWYFADGELFPSRQMPVIQTLEEAKQELREHVTALRWEHETGGVTVDGVRVATALQDQNRIASVLAAIHVATVMQDQNQIASLLNAIRVAPLDGVDFKAESGWVYLTAAELQGIASVIAAHVQACFSAERAHHEAIDALSSLDDVYSYDANALWPQ